MTLTDAESAALVATLLTGNVVLLGLGAWVWARAVAEANRIRGFRMQVNSEYETTQAALDAHDALQQRINAQREPPPVPTDEEIRAAIRLERQRANGHATVASGLADAVTPGDEDVEPANPFGGGEYRV